MHTNRFMRYRAFNITTEELKSKLQEEGYIKAFSFFKTVMFIRFEEDEYYQIVWRFRYGLFRKELLFIEIEGEYLNTNIQYRQTELDEMINRTLKQLKN